VFEKCGLARDAGETPQKDILRFGYSFRNYTNGARGRQ
jgi:hypothetical protein